MYASLCRPTAGPLAQHPARHTAVTALAADCAALEASAAGTATLGEATAWTHACAQKRARFAAETVTAARTTAV